ncbi:hypothetical protein GCM10011386_09850 [Parapedobacter defluvii]|uniref:DUF3817 domain-containing protein n=1 Tax=Parapedobacter defluvii TaxID=2045106 RepID=A0ABQ1L5V8_9SPHI|nr:hypothetical protein GCM10011386_09850 [Parapedobacter defluvii]
MESRETQKYRLTVTFWSKPVNYGAGWYIIAYFAPNLIIMSANNKILDWFRNVALVEGISMVVLVTFSVLKRTTDFEWAALGVKYVGWAHGILFIAYVYLLWMCTDKYKWKFSRVAIFFLASLIPFAPFFVERKLRHEERS